MPDGRLIPRLWDDWCRHGRPQIWITAFWEGGGNSDAFAFYTSRAIHERAEALALSDTAPPELARMASDVASVIEANADWSQPGRP